jgi:hypothetical protein
VRTRHDLDSDVVRCVVSANASAGSTSGETEVKGKYSGLGRPARRCRDNSTRGQIISVRKVRKVVGMVYSVRVLLPKR